MRWVGFSNVQQQLDWINDAAEVFKQPEEVTTASDTRPNLFRGIVNPVSKEGVSVSREEFTKLSPQDASQHLDTITRKDPLTGQYLFDG